jgi:hypothetical protein
LEKNNIITKALLLFYLVACGRQMTEARQPLHRSGPAGKRHTISATGRSVFAPFKVDPVSVSFIKLLKFLLRVINVMVFFTARSFFLHYVITSVFQSF